MIEVSVSEVDGIRFYTRIRLLEPDAFKYGIPVHFVSDKVRMEAPEIINMLKRLGLRKVYRDASQLVDAYTIFPVPYWRFKIIEFIFSIYWKYFTPYCWYRRIRKR